MNQNKLDQIASDLIKLEKASLTTYPKVGILLSWKNDTYIENLQAIAPRHSREIVLLSKTSKPLAPNLAIAIRNVDKGRLEITADNNLDLGGRQHVLRRVRERLTIMTPEQTEYISRNMPRVYEI